MRYLLIVFAFACIASQSFAQDKSFTEKDHFSVETALGADLFKRAHFSGLVKYNVLKNFAVATQTNISHSYRSMGEVVSISQDDFQSINFSFSQRFGAGAVIGKERFSHTFLLMAGPRYYHLKESHSYPQFEDASIRVSTWIPDTGLMYSFKIGKRKTYFTTQLYIPFLRIPDNLMEVSLSFGIGLQ